MKFNNLVENILVENRQLTSPNPRIYTLELTDNGLFRRVYHHDGRITYSLDKEGRDLHNLDGPAIHIPGEGAIKGHNSYYINGIFLPKEEWERKRLVYDIKDPHLSQNAADMLDI